MVKWNEGPCGFQKTPSRQNSAYGLVTVLSLTWESPHLGKMVFILRRCPEIQWHSTLSSLFVAAFLHYWRLQVINIDGSDCVTASIEIKCCTNVISPPLFGYLLGYKGIGNYVYIGRLCKKKNVKKYIDGIMQDGFVSFISVLFYDGCK